MQDAYRLHLQTGQGRTPDTIRTYSGHLSRYIAWCEEAGVGVVHASEGDVMAHVADALGRFSISYVNTRCSVLKSFYGWLMSEGQRRGNPADKLRMRKEKVELRPPYSLGELRRLIEAASGQLRETAMLLLFIDGGIRRSELLSMNIEDVDFLRGEVRIRGKGTRQRTIAPGRTAMRSLWEYVGSRRKGAVWLGDWGKRLTKTSLWRIMRALAKEARVDNVHPHRFRTTAICRLLERGADLISVAVIVDHRSLETTRRYQRAVERERALAQQRRLSLGDELASKGVAGLKPSAQQALALSRAVEGIRATAHHGDGPSDRRDSGGSEEHLLVAGDEPTTTRKAG